MSFSVSTNGLAYITDFASAEYHYHNFTPIRGRSKDDTGAALGRRSDWNIKSLHRRNFGDADAFRLYNTDVVTSHRDGHIELDLSYPSQSTDVWANHWLRRLAGHVYCSSGHKMLSIYSDKLDLEQLELHKIEVAPVEPNSHLHFYTDTYNFVLRPRIDKRWYVEQTAPRYVLHVDKSKASQVRKLVKPALEYLKIYELMPMTQDDSRAMTQEYNGNVFADVCRTPDDETLWPYLAAKLHYTSYRYDWQSGGRSYTCELVPDKERKNILYPNLYRAYNCYVPERLPFGTTRRAELYTSKAVDRREYL